MQRIIPKIFAGAVKIVPGFYCPHFTGNHVVDPYTLIKCDIPVKLFQKIIIEGDDISVVIEQDAVIELTASVSQIDIHRAVHIGISYRLKSSPLGGMPVALTCFRSCS